MLCAGGAESRGIVGVSGETASGALYTSRGPTMFEHGIQYKGHNEDAAAVIVVPAASEQQEEIVGAGAFDQAGGMGEIPGQRGASSKAACVAFETAMRAIAAGADPETALRDAVLAAHVKVVAMNACYRTSSVTTMAVGVIRDACAHVVNVGDSKVLHFSRDGVCLNETASHNLGEQRAREAGDPNRGLDVCHVLTRSIGQINGLPMADYATWPVHPGDMLVFATDGLLDANLIAQERDFWGGEPWTETAAERTIREIGKIVGRSPSAETAAELLRDYALGNMVSKRAKPDNISIVVIRID